MAADRSRVPRNLDYEVVPIKGYEVGSWCPLPDGKGKPEMVVIELMVPGAPAPMLLRLKSRRAAEEMIGALTFHMNDVWPTP